jgi:ABC-2 type transport system ATP-binding protein
MQPNSGKARVFGGDPTNPHNRMRTGAMLQVGRVPETLRVREHIDLFSSYYPRPLALERSAGCGGFGEIAPTASSAIFPAGSDSEPCLRWPSAAILTCCFSTSLPSASTSKPAVRSGKRIRRLVERGKTVLLTTHHLQEADALADRIAVINEGAIIAEGTPAEIKAQTSGKRIRCVTTLNLASLLQIPGVTDAKQDREAVEIHASEAEPVVRALLARDASLSGLEITSAGLEEAFLALTQDNGENANREN